MLMESLQLLKIMPISNRTAWFKFSCFLRLIFMYLGPCTSGPYGFIGLVPIMYAPGPGHGSRAAVPGERGDTGHPSRHGAAVRC